MTPLMTVSGERRSCVVSARNSSFIADSSRSCALAWFSSWFDSSSLLFTLSNCSRFSSNSPRTCTRSRFCRDSSSSAESSSSVLTKSRRKSARGRTASASAGGSHLMTVTRVPSPSFDWMSNSSIRRRVPMRPTPSPEGER